MRALTSSINVASIWVVLTLAFCGCEPPPDPYAEHLREQRNKAIKQLEQRAERDKTLDILCWDFGNQLDKPLTAKKWATSHRGLDVLAMSGSDLARLKQAADMTEVVNSLERGWPAVAGSNEPDESGTQPSHYTVLNANGFRFDGVATTPIEGWRPGPGETGRVDPPIIVRLSVRYTAHEFILVYLTECQAVSDSQWAALSAWLDQQTSPAIVFGKFDAGRLNHTKLATVDPDRLVISKSIEAWRFEIEDLESPLGGESRPYMIRCKEILPVDK